MKPSKLFNISLALSAAFFALFYGYAHAQTSTKGGIGIKVTKVKKESRQVSVSMTFDLDSLKLPSNRYITLTPFITDGRDSLELRQIILSGRRQHIIFERERKKYPNYTGAEEMQFRPGKTTNYRYETTVPYEKWMHGATLAIDEEWCGCGGHTQENDITNLTSLNLLPSVYTVQPKLVYVEPKAEAVKSRVVTGKAFLDFRINKTNIDRTYRKNTSELAKIQETIDKVKNDPDLSISRITIHGYASPEGRYEHNKNLAAGRTAALKEYVRSLYHFNDSLITAASTPEDWEGFLKMTEESNITDKEKVLEIINNTEATPDKKERMLRGIGNGSTYRYILQNWFPALRHSDYAVHYIIRGFNVEEAKVLIATRPQKLSLHEMFVVSGEYEPGSEDFNQVFDVAVRMYPEDPTANLNAANTAISDGVYDKAEKYLKKAGDTPQAIHNRGVLALLKGDYETALSLLVKAKELGIKEAEHNITELEKKLENNKHFN